MFWSAIAVGAHPYNIGERTTHPIIFRWITLWHCPPYWINSLRNPATRRRVLQRVFRMQGERRSC